MKSTRGDAYERLHPSGVRAFLTHNKILWLLQWLLFPGNGYVIHLVTKEERKSFLQGVSSQLRRCSSLLGSGSSSMLSDTASSTEGFIWKQRFFDVAEKRRAKKNNLLDGNFPWVFFSEAISKVLQPVLVCINNEINWKFFDQSQIIF